MLYWELYHLLLEVGKCVSEPLAQRLIDMANSNVEVWRMHPSLMGHYAHMLLSILRETAVGHLDDMATRKFWKLVGLLEVIRQTGHQNSHPEVVQLPQAEPRTGPDFHVSGGHCLDDF